MYQLHMLIIKEDGIINYDDPVSLEDQLQHIFLLHGNQTDKLFFLNNPFFIIYLYLWIQFHSLTVRVVKVMLQ